MNQFGFMKDLYINHKLKQKMLETFARNQHMIALFFDIEKGYNTIENTRSNRFVQENGVPQGEN